MTMEKQEHMTAYLSGYLDVNGAFVRNRWTGKSYDMEGAVEKAREYADQGTETLRGFGVDALLTPVVVTREVWYDESEPERV